MTTFYEVFDSIWSLIVPSTIYTEYADLFEYLSLALSLFMAFWLLRQFYRLINYFVRDKRNK